MSGTRKCAFDAHDVKTLRRLYEVECMPVHDIRTELQCCTARLRKKIKELGLKRSRCMLQVGIETKRAKRASANLDELDERMEPEYEEYHRSGYGRSLGRSWRYEQGMGDRWEQAGAVKRW